MPPRPTDSTITQWQDDFDSADTNVPQGTDVVGSFLDDQLRIIKSTERKESINKGWERWLGKITAFTFSTGTQFTCAGDQRTVFAGGTAPGGPCEVGRRIKATVTAGTVYGFITSVSFSAGTTTVNVTNDSGALDSGLSEVQFGSVYSHNSNIPQDVETQTVTPLFAVASGTNTYTATLAPAITAYKVGQVYKIQFTNANTGASTLALNGLTATAIVKVQSGGSAGVLLGSEIGAGALFSVMYDGTNFQLSPAAPAVSVLIGATSTFAPLIGTASFQVGAVSTSANTTETDLYTYSLPANAFTASNKGLRVKAFCGSANASTNTRRFRLYFGTAVVGDWTVAPTTAVVFNIDFEYLVKRTGNSTQTAISARLVSDSPGALTITINTTGLSNLTQTDTAGITIKVTGQNGTATAGDCTANAFHVEYLHG